jgi:hypothetical protein
VRFWTGARFFVAFAGGLAAERFATGAGLRVAFFAGGANFGAFLRAAGGTGRFAALPTLRAAGIFFAGISVPFQGWV